jgi:hypothetical protein
MIDPLPHGLLTSAGSTPYAAFLVICPAQPAELQLLQPLD